VLLEDAEHYGSGGVGDIVSLLLAPIEWQKDAACADVG
jgi:hypothetical protein